MNAFIERLRLKCSTGGGFESFAALQAKLDRWREIYNHQRPHEALQMATPITRYQPSPRNLPEKLAPVEYGPVMRYIGWDGPENCAFAGESTKYPTH